MNNLLSVPTFLTRYYRAGEHPFLSLNDLSLKDANALKARICEKENIGDFYAQDDYLIHRRHIEKWIYSQLISKGSSLECDVPIYMTLGISPPGKYDIRADLLKNGSEIVIPVELLNLTQVSFTFPDSMYKIDVDERGNEIGRGRTNTPEIYTYSEIPELIRKYRLKNNYTEYIEAQVWCRTTLNELWRSGKLKTYALGGKK